MKSILKIDFDAIMTYDEWTVFKFNNKYYVAVIDDGEIVEVELSQQIKNTNTAGIEFVDLGGDYDGMSDDMEWLLSFKIISKTTFLNRVTYPNFP